MPWTKEMEVRTGRMGARGGVAQISMEAGIESVSSLLSTAEKERACCKLRPRAHYLQL